MATCNCKQDINNLAAEVESLKVNQKANSEYIHRVFEMVDTMWTPPWKKAWFVVNGWPLYRLADKPKKRFWHRWTGI